MTRTFLPAAASALLALVGLPALASTDALASDAPASAGLTADSAADELLDVAPADTDAADAMAPGADTERAARRGGGKSGNKSSARSGGRSGGGQPAARNGGAPRGQQPARAPAGGASSARTSSGERSGGPPLARPMTQRPGADRVQVARPGTTPNRAAASSAQRGTSPQSRADISSSRSSSASRASSPSSAQRSGNSSAQRPGSSATLDRSGSSSARSGSNAARASSSQRNSHSAAEQRAHSGSNSQRAHVGPKAANKVEQHRGNHGDAGKRAGHPGPSPKAHRGGGRTTHRHVVHHRAGVPPRWAVSYHRYHLHGVPRYSPRYWGAGVFYYNPPPASHRVVVVDNSGQRVKGATKPKRAIDRNNSFAVGLRSGSYMSGYDNGGSYGDLGMGLALRYRPHEAVGLELAWQHHSDSWDEHTERAQDPLSASVELFAFPWTRVSPYALLGVTMTPRAAKDTYANRAGTQEYQANDALFGPHAGLGIEFAIGKKMSLNFDGRYIGYVDVQPDDAAIPAAFQGNMGLNFHF